MFSDLLLENEGKHKIGEKKRSVLGGRSLEKIVLFIFFAVLSFSSKMRKDELVAGGGNGNEKK